MRRTREAVRLACAAAAIVMASGCGGTEKTVRYKPFFTGLQDAEFSGVKPVNPEGGRIDPALRQGNASGVVERPDGSKLYLTYSPMQLFAHVQTLLDEETPEADRIILDQLIDEKTKEHYRSKGHDPIGYIEYLHENRKQLGKSLARMPMGEHSPTVIVDQPGDRQWVLNITGQASEGLKFKQIWIRQDMGQWKLEWLK